MNTKNNSSKLNSLSIKSPRQGKKILWGWKPRAPFKVLLSQALYDIFSRPLFLSLILIALIVGVCQIAVFLSVIIGVQNYVDDAMTSGSRLNRVVIKPKSRDRGKPDRFPVSNLIKSWETTDKVVARRTTLAKLVTTKGEIKYTAMGLHPNDPEYQLLDFVAGKQFSGNHDQLEIILTTALLNDIFDTETIQKRHKSYQSLIGQKVKIKIPQFTATGRIKNEVSVFLTISGIILHAEGGRQLYLPNITHLAFDRFKMDRHDLYPLPLNKEANAWTDQKAVLKMANFPWEDSLHIYAKEMSGVMTIIKDVAKLGYKPKSDIWKFKWALDVQDTAWSIFLPLLILIGLAVSITVSVNIFTSAKLRETELALWRVLGMRRGDLVLTQVISTIFSISLGTVLGLLLSWGIIEKGKSVLAQRSEEAALQKIGETQNLEAIFAPVSQFYIWIFLTALILGILVSLYPAFRTAKTDPAKVLQS